MSKVIYEKLLQIQKDIKGLTKDKAADKYQYISGDKLLGFVRPMMDRLGLLLLPEVVSSDFTRQDYATGKGGKSEMFVALKMKFTWVDVETGETLEQEWASSGQNNWDKGLGSALTYGERYYLLKCFHIPTDFDDVDAHGEIDEDNLNQTIAWINTLTTPEQMQDAWRTYGDFYGKEKAFVTAFTKRQKEIANGTR